MADPLTTREQALVAKGQQDAVREKRRHLQLTMHEDLCTAVEKITGRQVVEFFSGNHIDPDIDMEGFALAPRGRSDRQLSPGQAI